MTKKKNINNNNNNNIYIYIYIYILLLYIYIIFSQSKMNKTVKHCYAGVLSNYAWLSSWNISSIKNVIFVEHILYSLGLSINTNNLINSLNIADIKYLVNRLNHDKLFN